ncbi:MAG TPA: hypothetical protein VHW44_05120 [Pseudonocardiaceae bacterium]|jgi:uncharacterized membrane protein|nr:hypothetical protein [Pseudonocardiaceae bacterium]
MKKWVFTVVGIVLVLLGVLWVLQGSGEMSGSTMSGEKQFLVIGVVVGIIGLGLLVTGVRTFATARRS